MGPISSGILVEAFGFRSTADLIASIMLTYALVFFIVIGSFTLQKQKETPKSDVTIVEDTLRSERTSNSLYFKSEIKQPLLS